MENNNDPELSQLQNQNIKPNQEAPQIMDEGSIQQQESNNVSQINVVSNLEKLWIQFLIWMGISLGAYIGTFIRIGISYYRIWKIETNYCIMYAQIIGCVIMGFLVNHKTFLKDKSANRFYQVLYISLTSGLCGSITTFSTWQMESNKNFFLQWDLSWGNVIGSYNGGRFFEWVIQLWIGTTLPLMALRIGHHISKFTKFENSQFKVELVKDQPKISKIQETIFCFFYITSTLLILLIPLLVSPTWIHIMYSAIFGCFGAYLRYQLSFLNNQFINFPIGTFIANIFGTWFLAVLTLLSKFVVEYYNTSQQAVLYGFSTGFCGCLTTISTFVNELDQLPLKNSYIYGISSNIFAQLGVILIYNIYQQDQATYAHNMPKPIDLCSSYLEICNSLLTLSNCPAEFQETIVCNNQFSINNFNFTCTCNSGFDGSLRIGEVVIDGQCKSNATSSFINVWPNNAKFVDEPNEVIDYCLSFENLCNHYFNRINCPTQQRQINGCDRKGIGSFKGLCQCGSFDTSNVRIQEILIDSLLQRRFDLLPYTGYPTLVSINLCLEYEVTCSKLMDHVQCPNELRIISSCTNQQDYDTWQGQCQCGEDWDTPGDRVAEDIIDALIRPRLYQLPIKTFDFQTNKITFDQCLTFESICSNIFDFINCPQNKRTIIGCNTNTVTDFNGTCNCGNITDLTSTRTLELVIDGTIAEILWTKHTYIIPPQNSFTLITSSNPYRPLMMPLETIPN